MKQKPTPEEQDYEDARVRKEEHEARMNAPIPRGEFLNALRYVEEHNVLSSDTKILIAELLEVLE